MELEPLTLVPRNMSRRSFHLGAEAAKRMKKARKIHGYTLAELATRAHTTPRTISSLLDGRGASSSLGLWADVARALKVTPEWLCFGIGEGPAKAPKDSDE